MIPPRAARLAALLTIVVAAGCGSTEAVPARGDAEMVVPMPSGVRDPAGPEDGEPPVAEDCDPRLSLAPIGALPAPGQMPAGSTMERIQRRGRLIVGVDQNTFLFGFRDPRTGVLAGFDIDIARELARAIFGDPRRVQFRSVRLKDRIPVILSNEVDVVVDSMTMTCDRVRQIAFSAQYFSAGQRILVPVDSPVRALPDLAGQKVCAEVASTSIRRLSADRSRPVPVAVEHVTDCLVLLQQGQVAAVSTDDPILAGMVEQDPNVHVVGPRFTEEPYGIAVSRSAPDLVRFVNGVLESLRASGRWRQIQQRWIGSRLGPEAAVQPAPRYRGG